MTLRRAATLPLVPVLDVAAGQLVQAVAGERGEYRPWTSPLAPHAEPVEFAQRATALLTTLTASGGREPPVSCSSRRKRRSESTGGSRPPLAVLPFAAPVYAADLDALGGAAPNWALWEQLARDYALWCDAGLRHADDVRRLAGLVAPRGGRAVLATEAAPSAGDLLAMTSATDAKNLAVSFDWRDGRPLSTGSWLGVDDWLPLAATLSNQGVRSFIVLDVAAVGTDRGPIVTERCRRLREHLPNCEILAGGGVRHFEDVAALQQAGCDAVLVASLLHRLA